MNSEALATDYKKYQAETYFNRKFDAIDRFRAEGELNRHWYQSESKNVLTNKMNII